MCGKHAGGQIKPPQELPWAGIYHPKAPSYFTSLEEYLDWYGERAPLVGLIFPRVFWVEENLKTYNAVIEEIENRGGGAVAVFSDGWFGKVKNDEVIRRSGNMSWRGRRPWRKRGARRKKGAALPP